MQDKNDALVLVQQMKQGISSLKEEKRTLKMMDKMLLLLDISASMEAIYKDKRKIDHLRDAVAAYPSVKKVAFSTYSEIVTYIPEPKTSTDLTKAFTFIKGNCMPLESIILISDGYPDNANTAIAEGTSLGIPINVIYIGSPGEEGEKFMIKLAEMTRGKQITTGQNCFDLGRQIKEEIKLMITDKRR